MVSPINISLTGLQAASTRLANSANNVANAQSTSKNVNGKVVDEAYTPTEVMQQSMETGGVRTTIRDRDPATFPVYRPDSAEADAEGIVDYPNVDLAEEVVQQQMATYDYKANLKAIETYDELMQNLLDIKS